MRNRDRRLRAVEEQIEESEEERERRERDEFLTCLSDGSLNWLLEPVEQAEKLVDCPIHSPGCACRNELRRQRALEQYPELEEEYLRRHKILEARYDEVPKS